MKTLASYTHLAEWCHGFDLDASVYPDILKKFASERREIRYLSNNQDMLKQGPETSEIHACDNVCLIVRRYSKPFHNPRTAILLRTCGIIFTVRFANAPFRTNNT